MSVYKVTCTFTVSFDPKYWGGDERAAIYEILSESPIDDYIDDLQYEKIAAEVSEDER